MTRADLLQIIESSRLFQHWHWFQYHFRCSLNGFSHPLAESFIEACLACEPNSSGFTNATVKRLAAVGGRDRHLADWEQLLQQLAELHVVHRILTWDWPTDTKFEIEPHAEGSKKNPEVMLSQPDLRIGFEVKTPSLFAHATSRATNPTQIASRFVSKELVDAMVEPGTGVTMPRDNPIKDFLVSAEAKFKPFRCNDDKFFGILVIVWDNFIYEPISALLQPSSGLFTENSFFKDSDGKAEHFPSITGVVVVSHLHQLVRACRDEPLVDGCQSPLDFGQKDQYPWKIFIQNPWAPPAPQVALELLDARPPQEEMGAEYRPQELIMWIDMAR
jgi:hypothetical protein